MSNILPANILTVNSLKDLPAAENIPSLGYSAILIEPNTRLVWNADLVMPSPFYVPSNGPSFDVRGVSFGGARSISRLIWNGTEPLIHAEGELVIEYMNISTPNATVVEFDGLDAGQSLVFQNGLLYSCKKVANINGEIVTLSLRLLTVAGVTDDAITITGSEVQEINVSSGRFLDYDGSFINTSGATNMSSFNISGGTRFSSTNAASTAMTMGNCLASDGAALISDTRFNGAGNAISAPSAVSDGSMTISSCAFNNGGTALSGGASTKDLRVFSSGNVGLRSSQNIGCMTFEAVYPATTTTTLVTDTPVILSAAFAASSNIERWEVIANPANGAKFALRYIGEDSFEGFATVVLYGSQSGGGSPDLDFAVYKNGPVPSVGVFTGRISPGGLSEPSSSNASIPLNVPVSAVSGDYFDIRITRKSGGNNWLTSTVIFDIT